MIICLHLKPSASRLHSGTVSFSFTELNTPYGLLFYFTTAAIARDIPPYSIQLLKSFGSRRTFLIARQGDFITSV